MSILASVLSSGFSELIKGVGEVVDRFVLTSDEKAKMQAEMIRLAYEQQTKILATAGEYEKELTARAKADMESDSWLAKNIRPLALIYLLMIFTLLVFNDGNLHLGTWYFKVGEQYVSSLTGFLEYGLMFYFGGRSLEKIAAAVTTIKAGK